MMRFRNGRNSFFLFILACTMFLLAGEALCAGKAPVKPAGRKGISPEKKVEIKRDIPYYTDDASNPHHMLDVYYPSTGKNLPVVFYIHGGGWGGFDRGDFANVGTTFARRDVVTVVINFQLSPEVMHPEHVKDCAAAFAWTRKHIRRFRGDPGKIFVCGHSAGGQLASLLVLNPVFLKAHSLNTQAVYGVILISGIYDLTPAGLKDPDAEFQTAVNALVTNAFGDDAASRKSASPLFHARELDAPVLLLYAEKDHELFKRQAKQLFAALTKKKTPVTIKGIPGVDHQESIKSIGSGKDRTTVPIIDFVKFRSFD